MKGKKKKIQRRVQLFEQVSTLTILLHNQEWFVKPLKRYTCLPGRGCQSGVFNLVFHNFIFPHVGKNVLVVGKKQTNKATTHNESIVHQNNKWLI